MWPALTSLILALIGIIFGGRAIWRDIEGRRWGWASIGALTTLSGTAALVFFAHFYAAAAAGL